MDANKAARYSLITLCLISFCLQDLTIISFSGVAIKVYHVILLLLFPFLIRKEIIAPPKSVLIFFFIIWIVSLMNIPYIGLSSLLFNYFFSIYSLFIILNLSKDFTESDWISLSQKAAMVILFIVLIKDAFAYKEFVRFFQKPYGHPMIHTLMGGGPNLEATYIAMFVPLFVRNKKLLPYFLISISISVAYASRTALLINGLCLIWILKNYLNRENFFKSIAFSFVMILGCVWGAITNKFDFILNRFNNIGNEAGSLGRINMWKYALKLFLNRPIGYGVGNSLNALQIFTGNSYHEHNMHNLYFQMFIDLGFVGGAYYLLLVSAFFIIERRKITTNPIVFIIVLYFFSSMLQFRGAEIINYFFFAVYFQMKNAQLNNAQ